MGESHDFMSLDWVHGDIEDTLVKAQNSLEAYLSDTTATDNLQACGEAIHQVHGSLQMAGLVGALMLTEEIQALVERVVAGDIEDMAAAHEALAQAMVHLPPYLTRVQHETVERPLLLLGPANQIRSLLGKDAISDFEYFTPDLGAARAAASAEVAERFAQEDPASLKKLRQILQFALVGLIRDEDVQVNLGRISNSIARLQQLSRGAPVCQAWEIASGVIEGLLGGAIELESSVLDLLRQIDKAIKTFIESGPEGLNANPDESMLRGLLYHVAKCPAGLPRVDAIKQEYQLDQYDVGQGAKAAVLIATPDKQTIESVVGALSEELQRVKDTIDLYVRNDGKSSLDLGGLQPSLNQVASTLVLLNLEAPRIIVQEQISMLAANTGDANEISDEALLKVAEALLYVEAELESLIESVNSKQSDSVSVHANAASETVVEESLNGLRKAKDSMHEFLASDGDFSVLDAVPGLLRGSYGGLSILSLPTVPQLVFACGQYIEDDIIACEKVPDATAIETLAEVLATVEFYLEGFINSHVFNENILVQAKQGMASLGYPVDQADGITSEEEQFGMPDEFTPETGNTDSNVESAGEAEQDAAQELAPSQVETADIIHFESALGSDASPTSDENVSEVNEAVTEDSASEQETVAATDQPEQESSADTEAESFIDEEILEIFVEEAEEVFEQINMHWPAYRSDAGNQDALKEVRRAYHTLKGSGRMVGAEVIGELAWSVENMLNQLLEGVISTSENLQELVARVTALMPALLEDFRTRTDSGQDVNSLMACAESLARGEIVELPAADAGDIEGTGATEAVDAHEIEQDSLAAEDQTTEGGVAEAEEQQAIASEPVAEEAVETDSEQQQENEIYVIFEREAGQHLAVVDEFLGAMAGQESAAVTDDLYRALHTLKGSAHMAELPNIADISSAAEGLVKLMRERGVEINAEVADMLSQVCGIVRGGLEQLREDPQGELAGSPDLLEKINEFVTGHPGLQSDGEETSEAQVSELALLLQQNMELISSAQGCFENWRVNPQPTGPEFTEAHEVASQLLTTLGGAQDQNLSSLVTVIAGSYTQVAELNRNANDPLTIALGDAYEALINGLDMAAAGQEVAINNDAVARISDALEQLHREASEAEQASAEEIVEQQPEENMAETPAAEAHEESHEESGQSAPGAPDELDQELVDVFLEEAEEIFEAMASAKQDWITDNSNAGAIDALQRALHTLKGSSRMAGLSAVGNLSHELESIYENVAAGRIAPGPQLFDLVHECDDRLADMTAEVRRGEVCTPATELIEKARAVQAGQSEQVADEAAPEDTAETVVFDTALGATVEADSEALTAFFDTAAGLLTGLGKNIKKLSTAKTKNTKPYKAIQSDTDSLKDAAYAAGVHEIGDLSQIFIEVLANFEPADLVEESARTELADWHERLEASYQEARESASGSSLGSLLDNAPAQTQQDQQTDDVQGRSAQTAAQDTVRVSSGLLEQLVNLGGETSVSRARVEQQVSNFGYAIEEMGVTIERLREQLRRMEIETEAQILFRQEQEGPEHQGFDPLEMDRYSRMQELSRSLVESASDLLDLKDTLRDRARYTETILLQQSRINTELQEGLMKTRMVPFSRLAARLRRVARQVSQEVGKGVEFSLNNIDVELDRSLLEHMTAPLEHMLRNAIDHGIESPAQRKQMGKSEKGQVQLSLGRDGGDVVLELTDDGAGVDIASVRAKAVERGLIDQDAQLTDDEIVQFILHAGFSTAEKVTQISGRGVGMDVVNSQIKKLGGSIQIHSEPGQGSRFIIRVPFTVSVNSALMVNIGEETFALPLSTIEGVVRVSPYELEEYYRENGPRFEYAGQEYDLNYLGEYVGHRNNLQAQNHALPLPVILIRTAEGAVALQVDDITASREIVVKPLGSQLGAMPGLSGATILGDGRVVLILDMPAMVRARATASIQEPVEVIEPAETVSTELRVMVVDDSVTVRKVASRLLERHGMEVVVAKDGVEAMTKLQDTLPSVMLLDIEMPRMDGFELASLMRHDERLKDVPIIMITSRTGDKHRERALEIGVNKFMGKPFQEDDLLDAIGTLTDFERDRHKQGS